MRADNFKNDLAQYRADISKPYKFIPVAQMVACFKESKVGIELQVKLAVPYKKSNSHCHALVAEKYAFGPVEQACESMH